MTNPTNTHSLPDGAQFWWDPIAPHTQPPLEPQRSCEEPRTSQTFEEHTQANPPRFRPSHYTRSECFGNYNYIKVNGCWVDPDSEGEVFDALTNPTDPSPPPCLPIGPHGPRFSSLEEEEEMYQGFVEECYESGDVEGDPRHWRISKETFARWAIGAAKGDTYVEAEPILDVSIIL